MEDKPPSREERAKCWKSRDAFFKCLDEHNAGDDPSEFPKACAKDRSKFESACASSWVCLILSFPSLSLSLSLSLVCILFFYILLRLVFSSTYSCCVYYSKFVHDELQIAEYTHVSIALLIKQVDYFIKKRVVDKKKEMIMERDRKELEKGVAAERL